MIPSMTTLRLAIAALAIVTEATVSEGRAATPQPGPLAFRGGRNGAAVRIVVPAVWNGTLLVFQREYVDKADHPGEIENRTPFLSTGPAVRDALLARGYALAGSARSGWSVEEGLQDDV